MDFSKAFDKVPHDQLLFKIDRAGIDPASDQRTGQVFSVRKNTESSD